jgi:Transposase DDE domain
MIHPREALLQEARTFQQSEAFAPYRKLRQVAEHSLARLMQLGVRQACYVGRTKTLCQLLLAATVANLTLVASRVGLMRERNHIRAHPSHKLGGLLTTILSAIWLPFAVGMRPTLLLRGRFSATLLEIIDETEERLREERSSEAS